ncbi:NmrA/HSCARG family protein [Rufibacter psychrotolerans]|uniref:NmrA/HSCARG family protein n=1 Tax=Rufibacter psychrotolerans TaxID=2812556 RepID=UPI001966D19A|nr:NmrA/HSCARG family protein [Rufibacter sp. SYSU D00308]
MENAPTILVTGATGKQGGAVARHLLSSGFRVKALTRKPASPAARQLQQLGAELVPGDLDQPASFGQHLAGVAGVFSVQAFEQGPEKEVRQGIGLAELAVQYSVPHFIYSSVTGADAHTGIPHWESKGKIEQHLRGTQLSYTILRPASLYENFLLPPVASRIRKGKLVSPVKKEVVQQFISAQDIGKISAHIFSHPAPYQGSTITLAAEQLTLAQVAAIFSEVLGKEVRYQKLPMFLTRLFMGRNLYKMFKWVNEHDAVFLKDLAAFKKEHPHLKSLRDWIQDYFATG